MHCSLTVLALILLYGGHCFSVWLPLKVTLRLSASCNNAPQEMMHYNKKVDGAGLGAFRNGE